MSQNPNEPSGEDVRNRMASLGLDADPGPKQQPLEMEEVEAIILDPETFVLGQLMAGQTPGEVSQKLRQAGVPQARAAALFQAVGPVYEAVMDARRKAGRGKLLWGGVLLAAGIGIFVGTAYFNWAGGFYVFPVGFVLGGVYYLFKGASELTGG